MVQAIQPLYSMPIEGGSGNESYYIIIPRWPTFEQYITLSVVITNPNDTGIYYINTHNLTADITLNTSSISCWYKVNGGSWNTYNCYNQVVTFPWEDVNVTIRATDVDGHIGEDSVNFYIYGKSEGGGPGSEWWVVMIPLLIGFFLILTNPEN